MNHPPLNSIVLLHLVADTSAPGEASFNDNSLIIDQALREADTVLKH
jgi:hypothetical protein